MQFIKQLLPRPALARLLQYFRYHSSRKKYPCLFPKTTHLARTSQIVNQSGDINRVSIGENCLICGQLMVWNNCGSILIGDSVFVGENTRIWASTHIKIGSQVQIAHNCNIFDSDIHSFDPVSRHNEYVEYTTKGLNLLYPTGQSQVTLEKNVWIGASVTILKGVTIGENSIVGAGSVVTRNIPANVIAAGNPARIISQIRVDLTNHSLHANSF